MRDLGMPPTDQLSVVEAKVLLASLGFVLSPPFFGAPNRAPNNVILQQLFLQRPILLLMEFCKRVLGSELPRVQAGYVCSSL